MKILKYPTQLVFFLLAITFCSKVMAYDATLSLGNLCEYIGKIQTDESGSKNVCSFNPYVAAAVEFEINNSFVLSPELALSVPKSGRDENISKMSIVLLANAKYKLDYFHFILGTGLFISRISGSGGTENLNNGSGSVSYPLPEGAEYGRNFIVNAGFGVDFNKSWSADLHAYLFNLPSSEDRAVSVALNGTYHFGEF